MTAHNSVGKSEPSTPLVVRTQGSSPTSPSNRQLFNTISCNEVVLNLTPFKASLCEIKDFFIRIRSKIPLKDNSSYSKGDWIPLDINGTASSFAQHQSLITSTHLHSNVISTTEITGSFQDNLFFLKNLAPQTSYELEVTATNSAGTTKAVYDFYTKCQGNQ
jgi:hypothetical protein